jgi:AcrR family transcriptional regulator
MASAKNPIESTVNAVGAARNENHPMRRIAVEKAAVVLAGARSIFLAHGFSAATTDMIQQAAGVSKSTVYAHYANKEALFKAVIEAECETFLQRMRRIKLEPGHLREVLDALARAYLTIVLSPEALCLFRVVIAEAPRFPDLARHFYLIGPKTANNIVATHLEHASKIGEVDVSSVGHDAAAAIFVNLVRAEPQMQCLTHPGSKPSAAQHDLWASQAVNTFLRAFGTKERSDASR